MADKQQAAIDAKMITLVQTGSPIGRTKDQRSTLIGLGLNKMHRRSMVQDTPAVRGMVHKVQHLVTVINE